MSDTVNMANFIAPKSDQLNADDLLGGRSMTITIIRVSANPGCAEQPISINFEGDNGKPYKPCKSMRRVLVSLWGSDGSKYIGRRLTLYRDDKVKFGGVEVGGIRISHMSDVAETVTIALTASKAQRKPFTVQPLTTPDAKPGTASAPSSEAAKILKERCDVLLATYEACRTKDAFDAAEKTRGELWKAASADTKRALKAASEGAAKRIAEAPKAEEPEQPDRGDAYEGDDSGKSESLFGGSASGDPLEAIKH
jgi:hypothetical protein